MLDFHVNVLDQQGTVVTGKTQVAENKCRTLSSLHLNEPFRLVELLVKFFQGVEQTEHTLHRGAPFRDGACAVNRPRQGRNHVLEGLGRLNQRAQGNCACDIARRGDEHRKGHGQHRVASAKHEDMASGSGLRIPDRVDAIEQLAEPVAFAGFGVDKGNALAVFLCLQQAGPEIRFCRLPGIGGAYERAAYYPTEPRGHSRVEYGNPDQVAMNRNVGMGNVKGDYPGARPEHVGEASEQQQAVE